MRLQSSIGYTPVYVNVPDGSFAGNSCPTGYTFAKIWDEQGRYQVDVCIPLPPQPAAPPPPPPPTQNYVTVSPQVQVSPQISPIFQQQFQPQNSPASAGTVQTTSTPAPAQPQQIEAPQYAPPPAYTPPPVQNAPLPPVLESQAPPTVNNTPPPVATLPPASGGGGYATEIPSLDTVLNNPNIVRSNEGGTGSGGSTPTATAETGNKKALFIGLGALALLVLLAGNKRKRT